MLLHKFSPDKPLCFFLIISQFICFNDTDNNQNKSAIQWLWVTKELLSFSCLCDVYVETAKGKKHFYLRYI